MSVTATRAAFACSRSKGTARLVLLGLAWHVSEERLQLGEPWICWPGWDTLMRRGNCSRTGLYEALQRLIELGEIADYGERRRRGVVVWEVLPELADGDFTVEALAELEAETWGLDRPGGSDSEPVTEDCDAEGDQFGFRTGGSDSERVGVRIPNATSSDSEPEQEGNRKREQETERGSGRRAARRAHRPDAGETDTPWGDIGATA